MIKIPYKLSYLTLKNSYFNICTNPNLDPHIQIAYIVDNNIGLVPNYKILEKILDKPFITTHFLRVFQKS